ncbi:Uncharacterised protein [Vibrio cholerae]|nr:Uncharacterised protein [Vibrio cholerae]CSI64132.1 Uncharacterised protein [Vibrio cholerae]
MLLTPSSTSLDSSPIGRVQLSQVAPMSITTTRIPRRLVSSISLAG